MIPGIDDDSQSQGFFRASLCNTVQTKFLEKIQGIQFFVRRGAQDSYGRLAKLWMTVCLSITAKEKNIQDFVKSYHRALCSSWSRWVLGALGASLDTNGTFCGVL